MQKQYGNISSGGNTTNPVVGDSHIVNSNISQITHSVSELLNLEERNVLNSNINEFNELIAQLELEVKRISDEIGFDYGTTGYAGRLSKIQDDLDVQFNNLLLRYPKLASRYDAIMNIAHNLGIKEIIKSRLFEYYIDDLVYESLNEDDDKINYDNYLDLADDILISLLDEDSDFFDGLNVYSGNKDLSCLDLTESNLSLLNIDKLKHIFGLFNNLRFINFWGVIFDIEDGESTVFLISQLSSIKEIILNNSNLFLLDTGVLISFFNSLKNLRKISINNIGLETIDNETLQTIFGRLYSIKSIGLYFNDLSKINSDRLDIIFSNLKHVRYIDLGKCNISEMNHEQLNIIFSNLRSVWNISLSTNTLGSLDYESLRIIFSNLKNARYIEIYADCIDQRQEKFIRDLCPNTIINF